MSAIGELLERNRRELERAEAQAVRRPPSPLRRVVEPFRPPLERFGSIVLPLVGRAARRRATARVR